MLHVDRYIFREVLAPTVVALVVLTFVSFLGELGWVIEVLVRNPAYLLDVASLLMGILPHVLRFTIPMALLIGVLTGFGRLCHDHEITALRASGLSFRRLTRSVLVLACLAWTADAILAIWVAPKTAVQLRRLADQIITKQASLGLVPRVFNQKVRNFVVYAQNVAPTGWREVMLTDLSREDFKVTFARSAALRHDDVNRIVQVTLFDGITLASKQQIFDNFSVSRFITSTIAIPLPEVLTAPTPTVLEVSTLDLWRRVRTDGATSQERAEFHSRLALPFACFALTMVGLAFAVLAERGGRPTCLVFSVLLLIVYFIAFVAGMRIAGNGQWPGLIAAWVPNLTFTLLGMALLVRSDRRETSLVAWLRRAIDRFSKTDGRWTYVQKRSPTRACMRIPYRFIHVLDAYVLNRFWFYFSILLTSFVSLFLFVTVVDLLPDVIKNGIDHGIVAKYLLFLVPQVCYWLMPLAVLLATVILLSIMSKTNEITAVKSGAVSLYRFVMPLPLMGLLLSAFTYWMQDTVLPFSNRRQNEFRDVIGGWRQDPAPHGKWITGSGNRIYHYEHFDSAANTISGLHVFELAPHGFNVQAWISARHGHWKNSVWTLEDGWIRRTTTDDMDFEPFATADFAGLDSFGYLTRDVKNPSHMAYAELKGAIEDLRAGGMDVADLSVELNRKLSYPLVPFFMALIGIAFGFSKGSKGALRGIGTALAIAILYWFTFEFFARLGSARSLSPEVAAWFPHFVFGLGGFWMILRLKT